MDVEPLEAVLGIVLIGIALTTVLALRPRVEISSELYRRQVARSLASVAAYYYVHEFAYGPLNGTELSATLYNWSLAVATDTGLSLVVQLVVSNGTGEAGSFYVINQTLRGDVTVVEKPAPVYLPSNGTVKGFIVPARDVYRYGTQSLDMDYVRVYSTFVHLPSGVPAEEKNVSVDIDLPYQSCGSCTGCHNCTSCPPDHSLSGNGDYQNGTYFYEGRLEPIEYCYHSDGTFCCPLAPCESAGSMSIRFVYDPGAGHLNIVADAQAPVREKVTVPNRPWVDVDKHMAFVGETISISYGVAGNMEVRSPVTGKLLFNVSGVSSYNWRLNDPLRVSPGPWVIHMTRADDEYNSSNLVLIAPYVLFVRVYAAGGV